MARTATRAEAVFVRLRADILSGRLRPGSRLPFAQLSETYAVSMGVAREALSRLAEQGLVRTEPQLGYRVTPLSLDDLEDLTTTRCAVEGAALELAVAHGDLAWESAVVASHHALERTETWDRDDPALVNPDWAARHDAFHAALLSGCPAPRLVTLAASLRDAGEIYRSWAHGGGDRSPDVTLDSGRRDVAGEHRALVEAALDRDPTAAGHRLRAHLRATADLLVARMADLWTDTSMTTG
jgi:DNA-binding GntR family transcriptional regulator